MASDAAPAFGAAVGIGPAYSDAGVPGVTTFRRRGAQPLAEMFQIISYSQARDVFHALVAKLAGNAQTKRPAVFYGKVAAIHSVGRQRLRMQCVGHVHAVPPAALDGGVDHIPGLRENPDGFQDAR